MDELIKPIDATPEPQAKVGDIITGSLTPYGPFHTGVVSEIVGPLQFPDGDRYRYRVRNTKEYWPDGKPTVVFLFYDHIEYRAEEWQEANKNGEFCGNGDYDHRHDITFCPGCHS